MSEQLVIDELVPLRRLDDAVEDQHPAEVRVLEQDQVLMLAFPLVEDFVDFQPGLDTPIQGLRKPVGHQTRPRRCSSTSIRSGLKARRKTSIALCGLAPPHMKMSIAA